MALELLLKKGSMEASRCQVEAEKLIRRLFQHNEDTGAISSITTGQPGSCKTAAMCSMCDNVLVNYKKDKVFWRSALNAPIQIFKVSPWHIYIEKGSGIRLFDRKKNEDITKRLLKENKVTIFETFDQLYRKAKPGVCNCVFFRDQHIKNMEKDNGTIQWFRFIRYLLHKANWSYVFIDEYQEMVKSNSRGKLFWEIDNHADDVSTARKACVSIHSNCHQLHEIDYRCKSSYMVLNQMYGSRKDPHSPVSKRALNAMQRPTLKLGAEGWLSEGSRYGNVTFKKVYVLPKGFSIEARLVPEVEDVAQCEYCGRKYIYDTEDQRYCDKRCEYQASKVEKEHN